MALQQNQSACGQAMERLASKVQGQVILPRNPAYEAERKVWNGIVDRYPAAIVCCTNAEDVRVAVNLAREQVIQLLLKVALSVLEMLT